MRAAHLPFGPISKQKTAAKTEHDRLGVAMNTYRETERMINNTGPVRTPIKGKPEPPARLVEVILIAVVATVLGVALLPTLQSIQIPFLVSARGVGPKYFCQMNLRNIGLALQNYHSKHGSFPPPYTVDAQGNRLHSWRTLILPLLDRTALYRSIDLTKPWDHPVNEKARQTEVDGYICSTNREFGRNRTSYLAVLTPEGRFPPIEAGEMDDHHSGLSLTVFAVEVAGTDTVEWMEPKDLGDVDLKRQLQNMKTNHQGGLTVLLGDLSVRFISRDTDPAIFSGIMSNGGDKKLGEF